MKRKTVLLTMVVLLAVVIMATVPAYAGGQQGVPFQDLWAALNQLRDKVDSLTLQKDSSKPIQELQMAKAPTAPPFLIKDSNGQNVYDILPDGAIKIGRGAVEIRPDGSSPGLRIKGSQVERGTINRDHVQGKAIGRDQLDDKAVGQGQLGDKSVGRGQLSDKAIGQSQSPGR